MKQSGRFTAVLALAGALTLSACVLINKFDKMEAVVHGRDVVFTLPEKDLGDKDTQFMLYGIGVTIEKCDKDCVYWEMLRRIDSNLDPLAGNFIKFPIQYGVALPHLETRIYKKLQPGDYSFSALFSKIKNGEVAGRKKVVGSFTIE